MKFGAVGHTLDRLHFTIFSVKPKHQTRKNRTPINEYSTRPTLAQFTTVLCPGEIEILSQDFEQRLVRGEGDLDVFAVECKPDLFLTVVRHRLSS
jgi:hypothetical protein